MEGKSNRGALNEAALAKALREGRQFLCAHCEGNRQVGHSPRCPVRKVLSRVYALAQALKSEAQHREPKQRRFMLQTADELEEFAADAGVTLYMSFWDRHGTRPRRRRESRPARPKTSPRPRPKRRGGRRG